MSFRKIPEHCKISVSSVVRTCKEGPSTKQENKRTGRPPLGIDVLMYLDGVSFHHKQNPYNDALCPRGRVWRTEKEGLVFTSKGSKNLPGGCTLHLLVGFFFSAGVVVAGEYEKMNAQWFAKFVHETLDSTLRECAAMKKKEKLFFVMDNDRSQGKRCFRRSGC